MEIIKHKKEHDANWISSINWCDTCKKYNGKKGLLQFVCKELNCEVNHGGYDCPICKNKGFRRVMDEKEKERGICGDCGLNKLFKPLRKGQT